MVSSLAKAQIDYDPATIAVVNYYDCLSLESLETLQEFIIRAHNWHNDYNITACFNPFVFGLPNETSKLEQEFLNSIMSSKIEDIGYNTQVYRQYRKSLENTIYHSSENINYSVEFPIEIQIINFMRKDNTLIENPIKTNLSKKTKFISFPSNPDFAVIYEGIFNQLSTNPISLLGKFQSMRIASSIFNSFRSLYKQSATVDQMMNAYHGALLI